METESPTIRAASATRDVHVSSGQQPGVDLATTATHAPKTTVARASAKGLTTGRNALTISVAPMIFATAMAGAKTSSRRLVPNRQHLLSRWRDQRLHRLQDLRCQKKHQQLDRELLTRRASLCIRLIRLRPSRASLRWRASVLGSHRRSGSARFPQCRLLDSLRVSVARIARVRFAIPTTRSTSLV